MNTSPYISKFLIIDDEPDILEIIEAFLKKELVSCLACTDIKSAEQILMNNDITAVFCDINMPQGSGLELLKKLRSKGISTPFTFISAYETKENFISAMQLGAFDFVVKPFGPQELAEIAFRMLEFGKTKKLIEDSISNINFGLQELVALQKYFPKLSQCRAHNYIKRNSLSHSEENEENKQAEENVLSLRNPSLEDS
ncbi:MAG: response regulator [Bacteriovoracaceae bacterium]|nr:response regulator [Bacteriovoracaceae bacterium]